MVPPAPPPPERPPLLPRIQSAISTKHITDRWSAFDVILLRRLPAFYRVLPDLALLIS